MKITLMGQGLLALLTAGLALGLPAKEETVATAVYSRVGNGYKREKLKDGSFKPEYYALSNGGRIAGTTSDLTIDRVTYPEVAEIATKLLAQQNYRYAQTKEQAKLLLVLNWGSTLAPNSVLKDAAVAAAQTAAQDFQRAQQDLASKVEAMKASGEYIPSYAGEDLTANTIAGFGRDITRATNEEVAIAHVANSAENRLLDSLTNDRVRDQLNEKNARVLGYLDELADSNDIRRYAGGGDRYSDLITEVEESRYYIVVSAYDFAELTKNGKKKLLWQTRVSVRGPGNAFDATLVAMMKSGAKYFGRDSGRLIRGEETKGTVEMGDLKFLGEAKNAPPKGEKGKK
jgi:hypothetical protein